ncbi:hypothetical protein [Holdemania sp. Marseille-P2844]|uniref:hypothetical protein n=1 Tax=Holdemania sp. Marseille-P2844 TaxID=1852366 RepID=UPI000932495E|nr:hypothetical protein [Holdemania sp. Marseille-P2844]
MEDEKKPTETKTEKEGIASAFGNEKPKEEDKKDKPEKADPKAAEQGKTEQKQEGAESASDDKAQSGKTYTQAEVDAMMAKARKKYQKGGVTAETEEPAATEAEAAAGTDGETETPAVDPGHPAVQAQRDPATGMLVTKLARAEIKSELAIAGVDPTKIARAARLIDPEEVMENGEYSEAKAKEAVKTLLADWPELKPSEDQAAAANTFSFGAHQQEETEAAEATKNQISSIFGNTK